MNQQDDRHAPPPRQILKALGVEQVQIVVKHENVGLCLLDARYQILRRIASANQLETAISLERFQKTALLLSTGAEQYASTRVHWPSRAGPIGAMSSVPECSAAATRAAWLTSRSSTTDVARASPPAEANEPLPEVTA